MAVVTKGKAKAPPEPGSAGWHEIYDSRKFFRGTQLTRWNLWEHGVSSSFLDQFLKCLVQTELTYVQGWSPRGEPLGIAFGNCGHWLLERIYTPGEKGLEMQAQPSEETIFRMIEEYDAYWRSSRPMPTPAEEEQHQWVQALAQAVFPNYCERWDGDFCGSYTYGNDTTAPAVWLSMEQQFKVPYTYPDGLQTYVVGRRDALFRNSKSVLGVMDSKHLSIIQDGIILDTLDDNLQQMLYAWATQQELGEYPGIVLLNVVRRPGQRQGKKETKEDLAARIAKEYALVEKFDHHFMRFEVTLSPGEIEEWKVKTLDPIMEHLRGWYEGRYPHYANPTATVDKYGKCKLFNALKGDFSGCYRRDKVFPELD
jgi:hypothetical protein